MSPARHGHPTPPPRLAQGRRLAAAILGILGMGTIPPAGGAAAAVLPARGREPLAGVQAQAPTIPPPPSKTLDLDHPDWPVELDEDREPRLHTGGNCLIRDGLILTASHGALEGASILVRDGRIAEIGWNLEAPPGFATIDARGKVVMPGIIDCHSHMGIDGAVNEATHSITAEVRIRDVLEPQDPTIYRAMAGGVTTARLLHGSANVIGGQDAVIRLRFDRPADELLFPGAPQGIKFALGENVKQSNWGTQGTRFPNTRMGVEAVVRRAFTEARDYGARRQAFEAARARGEDPLPPRRDLRLEALAGVLAGTIRIHAHCYRADEILMLLRVAEDFGVRVQTLQHVLEGYKVAPEIVRHGAMPSTFSDWWAYKIEAYDAIPYNATLMTRAGAIVSIHSDSGEMGRRLYQEAAKVHRYGDLTEEEALRTITLHPAIQLGIEDRVGSIDEGKDADLAIFSAHPFAADAVCTMTLVEGEVAFQRDPTVWDGVNALADALGAQRRNAAAEGEGATPAGAAAAPGRAAPAPGASSRTPPRAIARPLSPPPSPATSPPRARPLPPAGDGAPGRQASPAGAGAPGTATPLGTPGILAITGGTVHPIASPPIERGTVIVRGGAIEAVGGPELSLPQGARVIDAAGLQVWPGMIDAESRVGLVEIGSVAGTRDTSEIGDVEPDLLALTAVHPESAAIPVTRVNGVTSTLVAPSGGTVRGRSSVIRLHGWTPGEMAVRPEGFLHVKLPHAAWKRPDEDPGAYERRREARKQRRELSRLLEEARQYGRMRDEAAARNLPAPLADPRLEALVPYVRGERQVVFEADRAETILEALAFARQEHLDAILAGAIDGWKVVRDLARARVPVILGPVNRTPRERWDPYDAPFHNAAVLHRAGVRIAFATYDASNARNLPFQAATAVAFGLPREAAHRALTLDAARILGVDDRLGSIEPGKDADLLVTDGDPIEFSTHVQHLILGGREVSLETKHTRLYERYLARLRGIPPDLRGR